MRILILALTMVLMGSSAFAEISGKVISFGKENSTTVKVVSEYTYPDGTKKLNTTRYNYRNFSTAKVQRDIQNHCETIAKYYIQANKDIITAKTEAIIDNKIIAQNKLVSGGVKDINITIQSVYDKNLDLIIPATGTVVDNSTNDIIN